MNANLLEEALLLLKRGDKRQSAALCRKVIATVSAGSPDFAEAHSLLGLAMLPSEPQQAQKHLERAVSAEPVEPQFRMNLARGLLALGRAGDAEDEFRRAVALSGRHLVALAALARFLVTMKRLSEAEAVVGEMLANNPNHGAALMMLAEIRYEAGDYFGAHDALEQTVGRSPERPRDALLLARIVRQLQDYDRARSILAPVLARQPTHPEAVALANMLAVWQGDARRDEALLFQALEAHPKDAMLVSLRIELGDMSPGECERFRALAEDQGRAPADRARILFALAQHYDRTGEFDVAWHCAAEANALMREQRRPGARETLRIRREAALSRARSLAREVDRAKVASQPHLVYLCGAPRTGGSLVQSVLAAAPGVRSVGERAALLPHLFGIVEKAERPRNPLSLDALRAADLRGLARFDPHAGTFVDKAPHNIHVAGLISAVHSGARFLAMLRNPADTLVSIFIRSFPAAFDYSYDPETIFDFLLFQDEAVAAWLEDGLDLLPVSYADFVERPAIHGRRVAEWAGIEWSPEYLDPVCRTQPVATFSARQVRQPIAPPPRPRDRGYAKQLAPLEPMLDRLREAQIRLLAAVG